MVNARTFGVVLLAAGLIAAWLLWQPPSPSQPATSRRVNEPVRHLLLVTIDTLRADRLGAYGYTPARTPTLDRLAREGTRFDRAFATAPITLPSHTSIMTGVPPAVHGVRDNGIFQLDPAAGELRGSETIHYQNRSPDALRYLWLFLEQNICDRQGITEQLDQPPLVFLGSTFDFSCKGFDGGLRLGAVRVGTAKVTPLVSGTTMRIDLPRPLASGAVMDLAIEWRFKVPDYGAGRMGRV